MKWFEITIRTTEEATEALADYLHRSGAGGVSIEESGSLNRKRDTTLGQWYELPLNDIPEGEAEVKAYFAEEGTRIDSLLEGVRTFLANLPDFGLAPGKAELSWKTVDDEDWANGWKQYYKPIRITDRLTVKPTWETYEPSEGEIVIELDPGMAFGTGTHPTTSLCLRAIERYIKPGDEVIDVGTGSGILAIAAAKLGAGGVLALDLDPVAVSSAKENVALNGLRQVTVMQSDLLSILDQVGTNELGITLPVRVVVSNILAEIILTFVGDVHRVLRKDGLFIASGIITAKEKMVADELERTGFEIVARNEEGDWVALAARKR
jgi:ribosomal protein L11 methyltransferase